MLGSVGSTDDCSHQFSTCHLSRVHLGAQVLAISLAMVPHLIHVPSFQEAFEPEDSTEEAALSPPSFTCYFVVYDAEYFCNSLYFEDFFLGCYCLANTITYQTLLSGGSHKSKGTKQWTCKTSKTGEQEMQMNNNDSSPLLVLSRAKCCSQQDICSNLKKCHNNPLRLHLVCSLSFNRNTVFVEHLPCAKHWGHSNEQDRQSFCPHGAEQTYSNETNNCTNNY